MSPLKRSSLNVTSCVIFVVITLNLSLASDMKRVRIVTETANHVRVFAKIEKSVSGGPWIEVPGERPEVGVVILSEPICDSSVRYRAMANQGGFTRSLDVTVACDEPEVVFSDFRPIYYAAQWWSGESPFLEPETWLSIMGDTSFAREKAPILVSAFQKAINENQYGEVALIANEVSAQLLAAGMTSDATLIGAIAIDATTRGILVAKGQPPDSVKSLTLEPDGRLLLSVEAQDLIEDYQRGTVASFDNGYKAEGAVDWTTIRSLDGAKTVKPSDWTIPKSAIPSFSTQSFGDIVAPKS